MGANYALGYIQNPHVGKVYVDGVLHHIICWEQKFYMINEETGALTGYGFMSNKNVSAAMYSENKILEETVQEVYEHFFKSEFGDEEFDYELSKMDVVEPYLEHWLHQRGFNSISFDNLDCNEEQFNYEVAAILSIDEDEECYGDDGQMVKYLEDVIEDKLSELMREAGIEE